MGLSLTWFFCSLVKRDLSSSAYSSNRKSVAGSKSFMDFILWDHAWKYLLFLYISSKREQLSLALKSRKVKSRLANSYLIVFCLSPQMQLAIYFKQLGNRQRSEKAVMVCLLSKAEIALHLAKTQTNYRQLSWSFIIHHSPSSLKHTLPPVFMTSPAFVF